jgi:probable rRNA maturation factor
MEKTETTTVSIRTKGTLPRVPFASIKDAILGKNYELSISFVGPTLSRTLNTTYRGKNKPTNVLSFSLSKQSGEVVLCESVMKKEYKKFNMSYKKFVVYLLIHGMLHLKGYDHGSTMENEERKFLKKFSL